MFLLQEGGVLKESEVLELESLLDWEANSLYPVIVSLLQHKQGGDKTIMAHLKSLLDSLEGILSKKEFIGGNTFNIVDLLCWCDLFPIMTDSRLSKEFSSICKIVSWFEKLKRHECFSPCLKKFSTGLDGCKSSALSLVSIIPQVKANLTAVSNDETATQQSSSPVSQAQIEAAKVGWKGKPKKLKSRSGPCLPHNGERNILITSALPYVNNVPHLGNIVGCVLSADVFARYCRIRGYNTLYVCGTDEYGTATETKALEEKCTPQQICDKYHKIHSDVYKWFDISFDQFGRTTTEKQTEVAQEIFWQLHANGNLIEDDMEQLHCQSCDRFLADRYVEGTCPLPGCGFEDARGDQCDGCGKLINAVELRNPRCKICRATPKTKTSKHIFIDLPKIETRLTEWLDEASKLWTSNARVIAKTWMKNGLQPRCITRDLKWGTKVPKEGFEDKVFYVWFDAPIGYISITAKYTNEWKKWWQNPDLVEYYEFMAKDNVPFHSVVFPATLLGTEDENLKSTEYLNYEDAKFSKSRGIGVFGNDAETTGISADIWRFYLIYTRPESADSAFKWDDL